MDTFVLLVLLVLCGAASADPVKVRPGDDVTLTCQPDDRSIVVVEWTRDDLKPKYVLFYRDGYKNPDTEDQYSSFQGRVQLLDRDLKDGDVSLTLKNVSSSDEGTYECRVDGGSTRKKRSTLKTEPIRRVRLQVTDSHRLRTGLFIGLVAAVSLVCLSVGLFVLKSKRRLNNEPEAAADEAEKVVIM